MKSKTERAEMPGGYDQPEYKLRGDVLDASRFINSGYGMGLLESK